MGHILPKGVTMILREPHSGFLLYLLGLWGFPPASPPPPPPLSTHLFPPLLLLPLLWGQGWNLDFTHVKQSVLLLNCVPQCWTCSSDTHSEMAQTLKRDPELP